MKTKSNHVFTALALLALAGLDAQLSTALAQGTAFTYQGRLADSGTPANGSYDMSFGAYDAPANGNLISVIVLNSAVAVSNGAFATTVDWGAGVFTGADVWLEISVRTNGANAFSVLSPRQLVTPVPYALYAKTSATANTVASSAVSAPQLNTAGTPASGQVLGYSGTQLVWQNPVTGGSSGGWSLAGNLGTTPGVNFVGTADSQPLEIKAGGVRALRLEPDATGSGAPNVIGGSPANYVSNSVVGATIAGGGGVSYSGTPYSNSITGLFGTIGGGARNLVGNQFAAVVGGYQNNASGYISTIAGGAYNVAKNNEASVLGGAYCIASGVCSTVGGGYNNTASGDGAFVGGGGFDPFADYTDPSIGNSASGAASAVEGGIGNVAAGDYSSAGGGYLNTASGDYSMAPGGVYNVASGAFSFAAGFHAVAANTGSFVWADNSGVSFSSSSPNQFLIRAAGGVGIGTAQPPPGGLRVDSGGVAVTGASSPHYGTAQGVFLERFQNTAGAVYAYNYATSAPLSLLLNSPGGNVGIGTLNPQKTLDVNGTASTHALTITGGADVVDPALDVNGTTRTHALTITGGADLAEPFKTGGSDLPKGSVVVIDEDHPGELKMSFQEYDTKVVGIISGANGVNPGIALHQEGALEGGQNVALSGRVYVLADATCGAIKPGDQLTTSATPGHARRVTDRARGQGAVLGKAMTGLNQGRGMVLVFVTLQ